MQVTEYVPGMHKVLVSIRSTKKGKERKERKAQGKPEELESSNRSGKKIDLLITVIRSVQLCTCG